MTRTLSAILVALACAVVLGGCGSVDIIGHIDAGTESSATTIECPALGGECCTIDQTGCGADEVCAFMATADCSPFEQCLPRATWTCGASTPCDMGYCCEGRVCMRWGGEYPPACHIMCRSDADCPPTDFWHCSEPGIDVTFSRTITCSGEFRVPYGICVQE